jgi:hypothetical protein
MFQQRCLRCADALYIVQVSCACLINESRPYNHVYLAAGAKVLPWYLYIVVSVLRGCLLLTRSRSISAMVEFDMYTHTYIHTYIDTYIHTYTHTCIHTGIHKLVTTCNIHTYVHTYIIYNLHSLHSPHPSELKATPEWHIYTKCVPGKLVATQAQQGFQQVQVTNQSSTQQQSRIQ